MYNQKVVDYFMNPRNAGRIEDADAIGEVGNPKCGDVMKIYLKINPQSEVIEDIKFETFGCAAAIATSSMVTELAKGRTLQNALKVKRSPTSSEGCLRRSCTARCSRRRAYRPPRRTTICAATGSCPRG